MTDAEMGRLSSGSEDAATAGGLEGIDSAAFEPAPSPDTRRRSARRNPNPFRAVATGLDSIAAVGIKELRGRVRGRRAFVILTAYLLFLAAFAWAWELVAERTWAVTASQGGSAAFASSLIGQEVFGALVVIETLLVVFLAPASTSGAISLEREKQTLDMLSATPISSLAIVVGKLLSALTYVFLLIAASIPLTAMVFVFGGVSPDDVIRAYVVLVVSALGLGSLGLFISAAMQRTQGATVVTFFSVLALSLGTMFGVLFWNTMAGLNSAGSNGVLATGSGLGPIKGRPPGVLLWFNPFAAQYDVICGASEGYGGWCGRLNTITHGAISVGTRTFGGGVVPTSIGGDPGAVDGTGPFSPPPNQPAGGAVGNLKGDLRAVALQFEPQGFGVRRDTFWPRSMVAWGVASALLVFGSIQLVTPTRRWRLFRMPTWGGRR